ncbi:MAG: AI-2E family transporter, partial [Chloroflexota bacterium]
PVKQFLQRRVTRGRPGPAVGLIVFFVISALFTLTIITVPTVILQSVNFIESTIIAGDRFISEPLVVNNEPVLNDNGDPVIIQEQLLALSEQYLTTEANTFISDALAQVTATSALSIGEQALNLLGNVTTNVVNISFRIFGTVAGFFLNTLFTMLLLAYFLSDGQKMIEGVIEAAPDGFERDLRRLIWELGRVWNDYLRGQIILGGGIAVIMWLIAFGLGLESPLFLAIFAGLMEFVPNIGPVLSIIPPILVALISGSSNFPEMNVFILIGILLVLWIAVQQVQGLIIQPRIMGDSLSL